HGDIAKIVACNRRASVYIPAEEFNRTLAIPSVWVTASGFAGDTFHVNITVTVSVGGTVYQGTAYATNRKPGVCDVFCNVPANTPATVSYQVSWNDAHDDTTVESASQALVFINKA
ncbi:host specificity protein J, partial [Salmonella enterica]|nr:host specificity protein J [Salmonella enterica]